MEESELINRTKVERKQSKSQTGDNLIRGKINSVMKIRKESKKWSRTGISPSRKRSKSRSRKFGARAEEQDAESTRGNLQRTQTEMSSRRKYGSNKRPPLLKSGNQRIMNANENQFGMSLKSKTKDQRHAEKEETGADEISHPFLNSKSRAQRKKNRASNPTTMSQSKKSKGSKNQDYVDLKAEFHSKQGRDFQSRGNLDEKQWESTPRENQPHSLGKRRRQNKNASIQSAKFMKSKRLEVASFRNEYNSSFRNLDVSLFWMLRVKEEVKVSHQNTCNYLKNRFKKIFINEYNSQDKFFANFKKYLREDENIYFLSFGQEKSGKTFSIQGNEFRFMDSKY